MSPNRFCLAILTTGVVVSASFASAQEAEGPSDAARVPTPVGYADRACVRMLEPGEVPKDEPIPGCTSRQPVALDTPQPSSFAAWANTQHAAGYQSITAKFTVPPAPAHHGRQILYIFPSLTGAVNPPILQPVLQWGFNTMFGGEYWVLAAWFVGNNIAAVTHPVVVNPGDVIDGSVVGTGACDAGVCAGWTVTGSDEANPSASVTLSVTESSTPSHYRSAQGGGPGGLRRQPLRRPAWRPARLHRHRPHGRHRRHADPDVEPRHEQDA